MESHNLGPVGLRKVIDAMQVVALRNGTTARELGETLGMPKSTAHRLVAGMLEVGLLQRADEGDRYVLGRLMAELVGGQMQWRALIAACRPHMLALRDQSGETIGLNVLHAERRVLLDQAESLQEHRWVYSNPLVPMPLHAGAAAKMLLALVPGEAVGRIVKRDRLVAFTRSTPRDSELLLRELQRIRARGYAMSTQEVTEGIASIAVPVVSDPLGSEPLAVMSLTGPSVRLPAKALKSFLPKLQLAAKRAADRLERSVGARTVASRSLYAGSRVAQSPANRQGQ